jgi:hypothetical protein
MKSVRPENELPYEVWHPICEMVTLFDYVRLRSSSKRMQCLDHVPTLSFNSYKLSSEAHYTYFWTPSAPRHNYFRTDLRMKLAWMK